MKSWFRLLAALALGLSAAASTRAAAILEVTAVAASPAAPKPGDSVTYTITFTNSDTVTTSTADTASVVLSSTNSVTGQTITYSASTISIPAIAAAGTASVTVVKTVPLSTSQAGACTVTAAVTGIDAPNATGVTTFTTSGTILTITGKPDLRITGLTYPAGTAYRGGDTIAMSLTYTNLISTNGTTNVPYMPGLNGDGSYFRIEVILSSNPTFGDGDDFLLTYHDVSTSPLNADGNNATISWTQLLPGNFAGSYYVMAKIDTGSAVSENVENDLGSTGNNIWFSPDTNAARISLLPTNFPTVYAASAASSAYSDNPSVSADGRYTAYASDATGLATGDSNGVRDIFVYDNQTAAVRRVSLSQQGAQPNAASNHPAISANGTYVAFASEATNLALDDTNGFSDIFVVNTLTGAIARVSVPNNADQGTLGTQANGSSFKPVLSATGRYLVFESTATNLVAGGTTAGVTHIYRLDRDVSGSGTFDTAANTALVLISQSSAGTAGTGNSLQASISGDGRYVAYASDATNLVAGDTNGVRDIFLRDVTGGTTTRVSVATGGTEATGGASRAPSINRNSGSADDGRYIAFGSEATNLVAGDTNGVSDVFVHDRTTGTTVRVSVSSTGTEASDPTATASQRIGSINPSISATGRYVAFASLANNLTDGDSAGQYASSDSNSSLDIFVHDRDADVDGTFDETAAGDRATTMVSRNRFGFQTTGLLGTASTGASDVYPVISGNGRFVAFPSDAENTGGLVHGATNRTSADSNTFRDIYLHDRRINALPTTTTPPSVSITSPVTGTSYPVNSALTLVGSASAPNGTITSVQFFVNGTSLGTDTSFPYNATWTPTATGTFALSALVTDSFGNQAVSSNINITISAVSPTSPTVSITSPSTGSSIFANGATTVSATASDSDGTIASVAFYANNVPIGTDTTFPYSVSWTPTATGSYTLTAVATDNGGNQTTTTGAGNSTVTVANLSAPTVSITSPSPVQINSATTITATTSTSGSIASVQFLANGTTLGTVTTAPFVFNWTPTAAGSYTLSAVATDNLGSQTTSANVSVTVSAGASPVVSVTSPAAGTVNVNTPQDFLVTATDSDGTVESVQFFVNGVALPAFDTEFPFATTWTPDTAGSYTLHAVATDNLGNTTTSATVSVTVTSGTAPTVSLTSPVASAAIAFGSTATIRANATANSGTIASVTFYANGQQIETADSSPPYTASWTPTATGTYSLTAVAADTLGNRTTTAAVSVTVGANQAPVVSVSGTSVVTFGAATPLSATATDSDGSVTGVQFYANGVSLGSDLTAPYSLSWTPNVIGSHTITAEATDNLGVKTVSQGFVINVVGSTAPTAPTVSLTAPAASATIPVNSIQQISATATPNAPFATIALVQFFVSDGARTTAISTSPAENSDVTFPYSGIWRPSTGQTRLHLGTEAPGTYTLFAVATDTLGNTATSAPITVTVATATPGTPTVALVNPVTATTVTVNQAVVLAANASDPDGSVQQVEFTVNGIVVGASTAAPYVVSWTPTTAGTYNLTATVTDNDGNRATTSTATITAAAATGSVQVAALVFNNPGLDSGSATPDPFAIVPVTLGSRLLIAAGAVDAGGSISSVQFFVNGTALATDNAAPFYTTHQLTALGSTVISALVTDSSGNQVYTVPLFVNVTPSVSATAGAVSLISPANGSTYVVGQLIVFQGTHNFGSDNPPKIDFAINGIQATTVAASPYQFVRSLTRAGTYDVHAIVRSGNDTTYSTVSTITVTSNTAPTITLAAGATSGSVGTPVVLTATADDSDGTVARVQFFANGSTLAEDTTAPYTTTFSPGAAGTYQLTALVTDNAGEQTLSNTVTYTVTSGSVPTVSVSVPSALAVNSAGTLTATAAAGATGATIARVDFFANGLAVGTATAFPFTTTFTPTATGTYAITAVAVDTLGNTATSSSANISVLNNTAPTAVALTSGSAPVIVNTAFTLTATASDLDGSVASVEFFANGTSLGTDTTAPYSLAWTPTVAGAYTLTVRATDNLGLATTSAPVAVTVTAGTSATLAVALTAPAASAQLPVNAETTLTATATPAAGSTVTVASVEFFANGVALGTDTTFPYTLAWTPSANGTYALTAVATDSAGNRATAASVSVTVAANQAPTVSIGSPVAAATVPIGQATTISATVADADGTVASVEFFANGVSLGVDSTSPFTASWTPTVAGTAVQLTAKATDNLGLATTSAAVSVNVSGGLVPSIAITAPLTGSSRAVGSANTITTTASAATGSGLTIARVEFFANNVAIGTVSVFPFNLVWTPTVDGTYALTAIAVDSAGNRATSSAVSVTVAANQTPTAVNLGVPGSFGVGSAGTLTAAPVDPDGTIAQVEFFAQNTSVPGSTAVSLGVDATSPFSLVWTPTLAGTYAITATATDNLGATLTSAASNVIVSAGTAPAVVLTVPAQLAVNSTGTVSAAVTPASGTTIAAVEFLANNVSLGVDTTFPYSADFTPVAVGTYGIVAIATDSAGNRTRTAAANIVVAANQVPTITLTPPGAPSVGTAGTITATAADADGSVASVQFFAQFTGVAGAPVVALGTDATTPFTVSWTPTVAGTYALTAVVTDNLGATTTSATSNVTVAVGLSPSVSVTAPTAGSTVAANSTVNVTATATPAVSSTLTIAQVEFFANGVSIGVDTTVPYAVAWTPVATGTYNLTARATDSAGNQATATAVAVTVQTNVAPTVSVTAPATLGVGVAGTITANAADADGTVASVQFFANGTAIGNPDTTAPFSINFTSTIAGSFAITAVATDNLGTSTTSAAATINVTGGNAPTVAITAPPTGSTVPVNVTQSVTATATAALGAIASVEFRVTAGGTVTSLAVDSTFPYATTWTPTAVGSYTLTALATDTSGNQSVATSLITVTATTNPGPSVNIVAPAAGATYTAGSSVVLFANASDSDGTVSSVRFLVDGEVVGGALGSAPYSTVWTPTAAGTYSITAIAVDNDFNATTSTAVSVTINAAAGTLPTVSITSPGGGTALTTRSTIPITVGVSSLSVTSVEFFDNGVSLGTDNATPFALNWSPTAPGVHRLVAVATAGTNIVSSAPVDITVAAAVSPTAPTISLTSPTNGATVSIGTVPPSSVNLSATASDGDGTIARVEFYVNGQQVGTDSDFPYTVTFTPTSIGSFTVHALAVDNTGNVSTSGSVTFTSVASGAPTVTITAPTAGASIPVNTLRTVDATVVAAAGRTITSVQFFAGATSIGTDTTFPYSVNWTPTSTGAVALTAVATDDLTVPGTSPAINVTVSPGTPPTGTITSPATGTNLTVGVATTLTASASATAPATIQSVDFRVNGASVGIDTTFPYSVAYTPSALATGNQLVAVITDTLGNVFTTTPATSFNVISSPGPTVAVTAPTAGSTIVVGTPTSVTASAAAQASGATVTSVQFFANGASIGTVTNAPYTVTWLPTAGGTFALTARATDSNGTVTTSSAINVSVTTPPASVSITGPTAGSVLPVNVPQTITASATSTTGTVSKVEFFANGASLGTDTQFPFATAWIPQTPGTFALTARATDNFGTVTDSTVVTVTVTGGSVPTVSISTPLTGSSAVAGTTVPVVVNATAANGTIVSVEVLANNVSIGTDTTFPYNFTWSPTGVGNVALTAVAIDSQGNRSVSAAVSVSVTGVSPGAPAISLTAPAAGASLPVGVATLLAATATDADGTIAQVEFFANGASLGTDTVFPYNLAFNPGATGNYVLTARATDNGGNVTTSAAVNVTVSGGTAPSVAITAPVDGGILGVNAPVTVTAAATSTTGFIRTVEFFLNGAPLASDTTFPYAAPWTPTAVGTYTLTARATDNLGNITDSAIVTVTVGASAAPTVAITNPATGSAYTVGTPLTVAATAADSDGSIAQVQFFVNGVPLGAIDTVSPYSATWTATSVGVYTLTAQATDNSGNVATSTQVVVTIGANAAPTLSLNSPVAGTYSLGNLVLVSAQANDSDGTVASVQFFANGLAIGTATAAPFNFSWRPTVAGNYAITAQATDNVGNVAVTPPVNVSITAVSAPAVAINNPVAGQTYGAGTAIPFTATPVGGNGPIAQVQFFVNGTPLGAADTTAPYSATWTPGAPGTYTLLAIATDSAGLSSSSAATLAVTISGNNAPTVAITSPPSGTSVNGGATVNLTAAAADSDGTVASVRFLANGNVVGTASAVPYTAPWVPSAAGTYTVTAQATDNSGNVTNSAPISVTVVANRSPVVSLTAPGNGATVRVSSAVNLNATATDADGTIASVQFYANGLSVGAADTTAPYSTAWTPGAEGIYRITAIAIDNSGAATTTAAVTVLAVIPGANGADVIYTGQYQGLGETGRFAAINVRGTSATFIAYSTQPAGRVYFYSGMEVDSTGGFSRFDDLGRALISGTVTDTGAVGTLDSGRVTFIGTVGFGTGAGVASGYYNGGLNNRPDSTFTAIVGPDGSIALYATDGTFRDAGSGTVAANGNFTVVTQAGVRFVGRADPASGFLTGSITGGPGGGFMAAVSSGVSFSDGFLKNLSTRGQVGTGANILFAGFVISGDTPKNVLIRAIGPSLASFGVTGALADTQLQLFNGNTLLQTNDNWGGSAAISTASNLVGAFPLQPGSRDSAILATLAPGGYTAQISGVGGTTGVALVELYDTDTLQPFAPQKVTNVATRGVVGTGANQLIAGFVVTGNTAKKVLIRAVGPTLGAAPFNVGGVLSDPHLRLVQGATTIVRENDNWETGNDAVQLREAAAKVGAFPLAAGGRDAAMLINLPPGSYSAQVTGAGTTTGIALVEVYEIP